MNLKQAKSLKPGDILHYTGHGPCEQKNKSGHTGVMRWKVNGEPRTWKTRPDMVVVPIKFGLYKFGQIHENELDSWHLESDCPLIADPANAEGDSQEELVHDGA